MTDRETMIAELGRDFPAAADRIDAILRAVPSPDTVGVRSALQVVADFMRKDVQSSDNDLWTPEYEALHDQVIVTLSPSHCTAGRRALEKIVSLAAKRRTDHTKCNCTVCEMRDIAEAALTSEQSGPTAGREE